MSSYSSRRSPYFTPSSNVSELLLRDVASLLLTSELISSSLEALRPECEFSSELNSALNSMIALCDEGESRIQQPLMEAGIVLPTITDMSASALITSFFTRLPSGENQQVFAMEVAINLQLLAQHVELKARLAGEEAFIVGLEELSLSLAAWSEAWHTRGQKIGGIKFRERVKPSAPVAYSGLALAMPQGI